MLLRTQKEYNEPRDLLIKRVRNGWVVVTGSHHDEEANIISVHEDTESEKTREQEDEEKN